MFVHQFLAFSSCFLEVSVTAPALVFRINRYQQFKNFEKRIMVATDLFGRGIDIERVNIVVNYDMPESSDSYLHR